MTFQVIHQPRSGARSPFHIVETTTGREVEWANRFLDRENARCLAETTLRAYAMDLLHFIRWWSAARQTDTVAEEAVASALPDYIRFQAGQQPRPAPATINRRAIVAGCALRNEFPDAGGTPEQDFSRFFWLRSSLGYGRFRPARSRFRVKEPKRIPTALSVDQVAKFWSGFHTARDLAIVGLMLLQGLRSKEVIALNLEDIQLAESRICVHGKGSKVRLLPLASETVHLLDHYLRLERPADCGLALFVSLKGRARGVRITSAGLRSLFRHHRRTSGIAGAYPHRFRHTFASDMVRAGISLPALMNLMGHAAISTTMIYVQISPSDVIEQYARAAARRLQAASARSLMRQRFPLPRNPMASVFRRAAESLTTSLGAESARQYQCTGRHFLNYLDARYPRVRSLGQLRRDPHILDWLSLLRAHQPPLSKVTYAHYVIRLRRILEELAWTRAVPLLTRLIRSDDIPRQDRCLPRPLTAEQDRLIQQELARRDDRDSNALLLLRYTGMRIGECLDLPPDCLRRIGQDQWAIHVPLGKLKTERMVPVDSFVCAIVERLRALRARDPQADRYLLERPRGRMALGATIRRSLHEAARAAGIATRIVPHQFRHTYATEMLRAGISLPVLMKLLGHESPKMTMHYVEVSLLDVEREFRLARLQPRHLVPTPKAPSASSVTPDMTGFLSSLNTTQHVLEMFRRTLPNGPRRDVLERLANRLIKIASEARKLDQK